MLREIFEVFLVYNLIPKDFSCTQKLKKGTVNFLVTPLYQLSCERAIKILFINVQFIIN